ncbi:ephrin-B3b isoform X1 [Acipenser ruthenus]|uniref:ephrin-B3b isoform X1 n=1 Tax=Acipenser ruthenus TaxID=7906 RepID=UPI00145A8E1A|nr:ephrin-B3b isoform X1 [Acipenser ruthenus]XP_058870366.1 ephrin-B3b isoform X1 [Acipenser ruthenus]
MGCRNTVSGFGFILLFTMDICGTSASNLEPIYWNSLNRRFAEEAGYVLYPQIGDRLDLICPASEPLGPRSTEDYEYYKLYLVNTGEQAARCEITGPPNLLLTCDKPSSDTRFTIKFQEYSPNLWGHEFKTHQDYYIIATSDGSREGLESMKGGACLNKGMKVVLKVGQNPNGMGPDPQKPNPDLLPGQPPAPDPNRVPGKDKASDPSGNSTKQGGGENGPFPPSNIPIIAGAAGGSAFLLIIAIIIAVVCYRRRQSKHSDSHHPPLSLSTLTSPKRGGNNNGSEPSDIIIPLRTSDSAFCPHYEKVSGDYGHPVYIVQEMPPQSPANIYYKV